MSHAVLCFAEVSNDELIVIYRELPSMDRAEAAMLCFNASFLIFLACYLATFPYPETAPYFTGVSALGSYGIMSCCASFMLSSLILFVGRDARIDNKRLPIYAKLESQGIGMGMTGLICCHDVSHVNECLHPIRLQLAITTFFKWESFPSDAKSSGIILYVFRHWGDTKRCIIEERPSAIAVANTFQMTKHTLGKRNELCISRNIISVEKAVEQDAVVHRTLFVVRSVGKYFLFEFVQQ